MRRDLIAFYVEDQIISIQVQPINWFSRKTRGEGIPKCAFSRKRLRERFITFASAVANVILGGRMYLRLK